MQTTSQDLSFLQKATAVRVSLGNLSFTKKIPQATVTAMVEAKDAIDQEQSATAAPDVARDPARISASKKLLDCKEASDIKACYSALKAYIKSLTLPSPFGDGIYFVPNTRMEELDTEILRVQSEEVPKLAEALIAVYDQVLEKDREALGPDFDPEDYDTPAEIRERLKVDYQFVKFGIPENLPNAMYEREKDKATAKLTGVVDTIQTLLRSEMDKLLKHAIDKLAGTAEGGKPLAFRNSTIGNIREFLDIFKDKNITDDVELEAICAKANDLLSGVDPQDLRDKPPLRESVASGFAAIRQQLDGLMTERGSRVITFAEDEEDQTAAA